MRAHHLRTLNEINMSYSSLRREAAQIGATVGVEFEMVVPGAMGEPESSEPDYDYDEVTTSIDQVVNFFHDGDHNSSRDVQRLREKLEEEYLDWFDMTALEKWNEVKADVLRAHILEHVYDQDIAIKNYLTDVLGLDDQDVQTTINAGKRGTTFTSSKQLNMWADDNQYWDWWKEAADHAEGQVDELVNDALDDWQNRYDDVYQSWLDEHRDDNWGDYQETWLHHEGLRTMVDVQQEYGQFVSWPHWTEGGDEGEPDVAGVAHSFGQAIGRPVNFSTRYHGGRREPGKYVVEPDGSIDTDDSGDAGLEFISPPMPLDEMLVELDRVRNWAQRRGCYTNESTGLHMNVSVPNYSRSNLDYVKLAMLLGDEHVLATFGRLSNSYCRSAFEKVMRSGKRNPEVTKGVFNLLRNKLNDIASRSIHGTSTDKYTSINVKDGYVEFRSPGGDYLDDDYWGEVKSTLLRFVVALDAACSRTKYHQEYLKKFYKALAPTSDDPDMVAMFVKWAGGKGEFDTQQLRGLLQARRAQRSQRVPPETADHQVSREFQFKAWHVDRPEYPLIVHANSYNDARQEAHQMVPAWRPEDIRLEYQG